MKKSGRGSVGRAFSKAKKYKEDEEWREKRKEMRRKNYNKNKELRRLKAREWTKKLNEFANKKCKKCGKLLYYRTKTNLCRKHWGEEIKKRWKKFEEKRKGVSNNKCVKCGKLLNKQTKGNLCLKHFREELKDISRR